MNERVYVVTASLWGVVDDVYVFSTPEKARLFMRGLAVGYAQKHGRDADLPLSASVDDIRDFLRDIDIDEDFEYWSRDVARVVPEVEYEVGPITIDLSAGEGIVALKGDSGPTVLLDMDEVAQLREVLKKNKGVSIVHAFDSGYVVYDAVAEVMVLASIGPMGSGETFSRNTHFTPACANAMVAVLELAIQECEGVYGG